MQLSHFIRNNTEQILAEWDDFARTMEPASLRMSSHNLRDHAEQILTAIAIDIDTSQSKGQELEKSQGRASILAGSAASLHGTLREVSGFTLVQLTAEFRALRASVLRLWLQSVSHFNESVASDIVRFNEAVDQALAESAVTYSYETNKTRDMFLAILGHDLRAPLTAIRYSGELLQRLTNDPTQNATIAKRLIRSSQTMRTMVNDLLEYSRTHIGAKIPINKRLVDLMEIYNSAQLDACGAFPDCKIEHSCSGELFGLFDSLRIYQLMSNLLVNACQHHQPGSPIVTRLRGEQDCLVFEVQNEGPVIPAHSLEIIFSALVRLPQQGAEHPVTNNSLGLGLFIAKQIVTEHKGEISVESSPDEGTTFRVTLPRR